MGTFSVYGIMGQKHGRVEVQIGICRGDEECADKPSDIRRELAHVRMDGGLDA